MLDKLKTRWKVKTNTTLLLILLTFACTGTTVAYISRNAVKWLGWNTQDHLVYIILFKVFVFVVGYQLLIVLFGAIFGQFQFFWNYEKKILKWLFRMK
jgi:hypothetical protein